MEPWSFGRIFAALGAVADSRPALIHGECVTSWADFDRRTDALAAAFLAAGATAGDRVAHVMRNGPAYLETTAAAMKARLVHVNVNYRYIGDELFYILDNADADIVVYDADFADVLEPLRARLPGVRLWLQTGAAFDGAADTGARLPAQDHRADDMLFIYTGGTTGHPKGVMWNQGDVWALMGGGGTAALGEPPVPTLDALLAAVRGAAALPRLLVLPPLMHGSGFLMALNTLARGGAVVTVPGNSFDPVAALAACAQHRPDMAVIVGDAFARPLLTALGAGAGTLGDLRVMVSSGTMWSPMVKAGLIQHQPSLVCLDAFGSSEGLGYGMAISSAAAPDAPTRFRHDADTLVLDDAMRPVVPGSGQVGRVARGGLIPCGYWRDTPRTLATFVTISGRRYTLPGDMAAVAADGSLILVGRGDQVINTGGEKVFPEEVEEALKTHPAVDDALVFGVADPQWGQAVTAVVQLNAPAETAALTAHVRARLAAYKAPKRVVIVATVPRTPSGKADYPAARALA